MKKTLIININGIIFNIDEDAFDRLQAYLEELKRYFTSVPEGDEITADIEARIAELMQPRINENRQSIHIEDIEDIIGILGTPRDIAGSTDEEAAAEGRPEQPYNRSNRRLYRDADNAVVAGVCAGFGAYFKIDPVIFRIAIIFLLFAGGVGFIIYPILWIALPKATTSAQKLEMKGEHVNVTNIERVLREEYQQVRENMRNHGARNRIHQLVSGLSLLFVRLCLFLWNIIRFLFGSFLILTSIVLLIAIISTVYFNMFFIHDNYFQNFASVREYLGYILSPTMCSLLLNLAFFLAILLLTGLIYGGLKLILRFRANDKWVILSLSGVWIVALVTFLSVLFNEIDRFQKEGTVKEVVTLAPGKQNLLYVNMPQLTDSDAEIRDLPSHLFHVTRKGSSTLFIGRAWLDIEKSAGTVAELEVIRTAQGNSYDEAQQAAKIISVVYTQKDSVLNLDPVFRVTNSHYWKFQKVRYVLRLPVGMRLYLNENAGRYLGNAENTSNNWPGDLVSHTLQMTDRGLEMISFSSTSTKTLALPSSKTVNIQVREHYPVNPEEWDRLRDSHQFGRLHSDNRAVNYGVVDFDIRKSEDQNLRLEIMRSVSAPSQEVANVSLNHMDYGFEQKDTTLWIDPIFRFPQDIKNNDQRVRVILYLPLHYRMYLSKQLEYLTRTNPQLNEGFSRDVRRWEMGNDGISGLSPEKNEE